MDLGVHEGKGPQSCSALTPSTQPSFQLLSNTNPSFLLLLLLLLLLLSFHPFSWS
jgi:hypothetical protein